MISLRPYQQQTIDDARSALQRVRSVLIQLPTGGGKTILAAFMLGTARQRGRTAWFIAHRDFLLEQTAQTFDNVGIPYGFIAAGRPFNPAHAVQIVSIGTASRRLDRLAPPDIIVWDEAHHITAAGYRKIYQWAERSRHVGLSATPARLDGKGLDEFFAEMVQGPTVATLMREGHLSQYRAFAPSAPDVSSVHTIAGDYNRGELGTVMDDGQIIGDMVRHYRERADGLRAIYFAVGVDHSKHIAAVFCAAGIPATHLDGNSTTSERRTAAIALADGSIKVLSNAQILGEGFDIAAAADCDVTVECVGLARPTKSLALHLQQVGRALRPKEHPAIILDHAGNLLRHGLPDDDRTWSLRGIDRRSKASREGSAVTQCGSCFGVHRAGLMACPYCGAGRVLQAREVDEVAGELREIDRAAIRDRERAQAETARAEQDACRTTAELIQLGRKRSYKNPGWWAIKIMRGREGKVNVRQLARETGLHHATIDYHMKNGSAPSDADEAKQWALEFKSDRESKISLRELGRRIGTDGGIVARWARVEGMPVDSYDSAMEWIRQNKQPEAANG